MLTYDLTTLSVPVYKRIYELIKRDVEAGELTANSKLPSKRAFAKNLGVSVITVENAYGQLVGEGYVYSRPKRGYFVSEMEAPKKTRLFSKTPISSIFPQEAPSADFDFSSNQAEPEHFPFSIWSKLMRETMAFRKHDLLTVPHRFGVDELREAIANHLASFRGMRVDPQQIVVGAGAEYLYGLLIKLLGVDLVYCIENPGYLKIKQIYESAGATCRSAEMDLHGIIVDELKRMNVQVVHISPTHHFPTGITTPVSRRYELLAWANEQDDRFIIEDDYDSEFRLNGRPIPSLQSIDVNEKVVYLNTFSKSLTSTIRISYMALPVRLAKRFYQKLSFYSNAVSTFEQYTLAAFIRRGFFEKHINRMRLHYVKKRAIILKMIEERLPRDCYRIIENDSGLHFLLQLETSLSTKDVIEKLREQKIKIKAISDYDAIAKRNDLRQFIVNYSNMKLEGLEHALDVIRKTIDAQ